MTLSLSAELLPLPFLLFESLYVMPSIAAPLNSIVLLNNHVVTLSLLNRNKSAGRDGNHKPSVGLRRTKTLSPTRLAYASSIPPWCKTADSSSLREPRVLIRVYVDEGEIDHAIAFYEGLHGVEVDMRFDFPEHRLVLATGVEIFFGPVAVPTGACFNARLPDGTIVEYLHHRPRADE